ncbi:MAG: hypothetical protein KBT36_12605, partial [Kurthia sp.]|nr:hypothetical protein [Candidatus Kurthia equi]
RIADMNRKFELLEKDNTIRNYADKMNKRIYGFGDGGESYRVFNKKEIVVIQYIYSRLEDGLTVDNVIDEAVEVFYSASVIK